MLHKINWYWLNSYVDGISHNLIVGYDQRCCRNNNSVVISKIAYLWNAAKNFDGEQEACHSGDIF